MRFSFGLFEQPSSVAIVAVLLLLVILVPAIGALVAARSRDITDSPSLRRRRYVRTMLVLWTIALLAWYALSLHGESLSDVGWGPPRSPWWYAIGPLIVLVLLAISGGGRGDISPAYARNVRIVVPRDAVDWAFFVPVAATAALCEEFLYRGYAFSQIASLSGSLVVGAVVSSIAFGLGHAYQGRIGMVGTALTGLFYSALFVASGSLWPCMVAHFLQDMVGAALLSRRLQ